MDITELYRSLVTVGLGRPAPDPVYEKPNPDAITSVVYNISSQLTRILKSIKSIRPRYLTLSGSNQMLDSDKDDFDTTVRRLIEREKLKVDQLEKQERLRQEQQGRKSFTSKLFSDPKADAVSETLHHHRIGMFHYLTLQLQEVSAAISDLQRIRYARSVKQQVAKPKPHSSGSNSFNIPGSIESALLSQNTKNNQPQQQEQLRPNPLHQSKHSQELETLNLPHEIDERNGESTPNYTDDISESQMQLIQEEHDELVDSLNQSLREAEKAEQSLREISMLQSELSRHLNTQSLQLESLHSDAYRTTKEISGANNYLTNAKRSNRFASRCVMAASLTVGVMLLLANGK